MDTLQAVRSAVKESGNSMRGVSEAIGRTPNYLNSTVRRSELSGGGLNSPTLARVADTCGYSLALIPKGTEPPGALVIDPPEA